MKNSTKIKSAFLCALLIAAAIVKFKSPTDLGGARVSGVTSSSVTLTLPANATPFTHQVWNGTNWLPATDGTNP